jgi:ABC-type transport system involved in multi-copper enzyme maturation permease subunit
MFSFASSQHLFWKEYRTQRTLWAAILLLALFYGVLLVFWGTLADPSGGASRGTIFFAMLAFPPVYAWACGALLFAGEHDQETFDFLRAQPVPATRVYWVKLATILAGTLLMVPAVVLLGLLLTGGQLPPSGQAPEPDSLHWSLWTNMLVTSVELLAWSILFSLILRRVLPALLLAAAAEVVAVVVSMMVADQLSPGLMESGVTQLSQLPRLAIGLTVIGVTIRLGSGWFGMRASAGSWLPARTTGREERTALALSWRPLGHLLWHAWRQSFYLALGTLAFWLVMSIFLSFDGYRFGPEGWPVIASELLVPLAAWAGLLCFLPDQASRRYPFFAERAVQPGSVWLSRQLVAAPLPLVWLFLTVGVFLLTNPLRVTGTESNPAQLQLVLGRSSVGLRELAGILWASILVYAVGQSVSLFCRSPIIGLAVGVVTCFAAGAGYMMLHALHVPALISAMPMAIALLVATRWSTRAWMEQVQTWTEFFRKMYRVALPLIAVLLAVCAYRVYEIPFAGPPRLPDLRGMPSAEAVETARMYAQVIRHFRGTIGYRGPASADEHDQEEVKKKAEEKILEVFVQAAQRRDAWFPPRHSVRQSPSLNIEEIQLLSALQAVMPGLTQAVVDRMDQLSTSGDLEAALDYPLALLGLARHMSLGSDSTQLWQIVQLERTAANLLARWASREEQTEELIQRALQETDGRRPDSLWHEWNEEEVLQRNWLWWRDLLEDKPLGFGSSPVAWDDGTNVIILRNSDDQSEQHRQYLRTLRRFAPWELARLRRLADVSIVRNPAERLQPDMEQWVKTTPFAAHSGIFQGTGVYLYYQQLLQSRRLVLRLQLALRAYQLEHGEYPRSLAALPEEDQRGLSPEVLAGQDPLGPVYYPGGFTFPVKIEGSVSGGSTQIIPPGEPMLVSRSRVNPYFDVS